MGAFFKTSKGLWLLFIISVVMSSINIFNVAVENSLSQIWYYVPVFGWWLYVLLFPDTYGRKSNVEIKAEWIEKAKSFIRTILQLFGAILPLNQIFKLDIAVLQPIYDSLEYIGANIDVAAGALSVILGFGLSVYGFFKNEDRFEVRVGNPHSANKIL